MTRNPLLLLPILVAAALTSALAQDMPLSGLLVEGAGWEVVSAGHAFTDGLCADAGGNLYFSDVKAGTAIYKVDLEGALTEFIAGAPGISGLKWGPGGRLYACVAKAGEIVAFEKDGKRTVLASGVRPNDLIVARTGDIYFTMTPTSEIRRIDPAGAMSVVDTGIAKPNGITLSPDQGALAVSDYGGIHVWLFRIEGDGSLAFKSPYMTMRTPVADPEIAKGDGMTTDADGRYYVTSAEGLQVFDPTGRLCGVILKPQDSNLVSVAFAGPELQYLHVACGDTIFRRKTQTHGALFFQPPPAAKSSKP